jgi:cytochrome c-type biogenesis protein CcmH
MGRRSPEEPQKTIRDMVDPSASLGTGGIAAKMQDTPNDRDGWLRLANARKVLGDHAQAGDAFARVEAVQQRLER